MNFQWFIFLFKTAFRNLGRTPRRTLISITAIAMAVISLLLFDSFIMGVKKQFRKSLITTSFGHYKIFAKGYREHKFQDSLSYQISRFPEIRSHIESEVGKLAFFSERQEFFGLLAHGEVTIAAKGEGINAAEDRKFLTSNRIVEGKHLDEAGNEGMILGVGLAKQMGVKTGDNITLLINTASGSLNASDLEVTGLFKTGVTEIDDTIFYIDIKTMQKLYRTEGATEIIMAFENDDELQYRPKLESVLKEHFPNLQLYHWHDLMGDYFDNTMSWLESQFQIFRMIILIIATLSISNVFMMSILERTGEFGTLRAIGTQRKEITTQILMESFLQSIMGSLVGVIVGFVIMSLFLRNGIDMPPAPNMTEKFHVVFDFPWRHLPYILLICVGISGLAGVFPAIKVGRLNIALALGRNV